MGHTNTTANIALPQFIGTDKPTWLGDVNGAFAAIDSKVGTIDADVAAVDSKADTAISDASAAVTTATNANNTAGTASTTATQANNIANNALTVANNAVADVVAIGNKMGLLADLHTTDKTSIVNAINEVADVAAPTATQVSYDNTGSGLTATNVQDAIDEVAQGGGGAGGYTLRGTVVGAAGKTFSGALDEVYQLIDGVTFTDLLIVDDGTSSAYGNLRLADRLNGRIRVSGFEEDGTKFVWMGGVIQASASTLAHYAIGGSYGDYSSQVFGVGKQYSVYTI